MKKLLKNGCVLDPVSDDLIEIDILIEGTYIKKIDTHLPVNDPDAEVIDLSGKFVSPGLIDMHVHFREPGFEKKETIASGTRAAARGGFTTVACMPNTRPVTDSVEVVREILAKAEQAGCARVLPYGAITVRELGQELTDMAALKAAGVIGVTDDGVGIQSSKMMKEAMRKACQVGLPVVAHCEDDTLAKGGCVHDGTFASRYHLQGIPSEAESIHVGRDILLAEDIGVHYHVCHISAEQSVRLVREAKSRGQKVTAEVTPHHLLLCDEDIPEPNALWKMNPPLRSRKDREALIEGLKDGTIDIIATDHAPHTAAEKAMGMERAPFGIVGLETAFPLLYTHLVLKGVLTLAELIDKMTRKPAQIFGLPYGVLAEGLPADLTVIDLEEERAIDPDTFLSKGRNTPFAGWKVKGWPVLTIMNGNITWNQADTALTFGDFE
ncbi:dihydroorotase [Paenactinomyces guangxiensis]|uniref:Dihydroorotase n=1 Tax=Paenactinomyces guangxiensis TaxID=1490290 RepID=A0A7W1WQT3_9BACL|nr:dihydroorotase [Paenactinomyces guangxiensis]MBA4494219.1 dihydroorotase [Paenactinomyces guangxiensis]MBH8590715.1 dihydroorotase [Paenactinomyces guangxiensis]